MRIDGSDSADDPGVHFTRRAESAPDDPDVADKGRGTAVGGGDPPDSSPDHTDSVLRGERTAAYRGGVHAAYQQYAIDQGNARAEKLDREPATPAMCRIEADDPESHPVRVDDRPEGKVRVGAANPTKGESQQGTEDTTAVSELPEGYRSSPALKGDPYHPDSVAARSAANQELYTATSRDRAAVLGYTTRIPAQKAPFDSHGQEVFTNGKNFITPDVDGHNVSDGWKMFSRRGIRIGTYDSELNYVKE